MRGWLPSLENVARNCAVCMFALVGLGSGCGAEVEEGQPIAERSCFVIVGKERLFRGDPECMQALPRRQINGFWVVGHEYSVLHLDRASIPDGNDPNGIWLSLSSKARKDVEELLDGERHVFEIRFLGSLSDAPGGYGNGLYKRGAWVDAIVSVKEIK